MPIEATCHCGAVRFTLARLPVDVGACNCSICRRLGTLWAYYTQGEVQQHFDENATTTYLQGDKCLRIHSCRTCGCTTHWDGRTDTGPDARLAINGRLLEPEVLAALPVRHIDGASW